MTNANLDITAPAIGRPSRLRADRIRRDTLTQLAAALREDNDNSVRDALDALIDAVDNPHDTEGAEIDGLCEAIEDVAGMSRADMPLTPGDVQQLAEQASAALPTAGTVTALPVQQNRRAS